MAALTLNSLSLLVTAALGRFHTILVTSWLVFLAAGFYGMRPLLAKIQENPHRRFLKAAAALGALLSFYGLFPFFPWLFTNAYRALFINLPFYAVLIFFLTESFFILENSKAGRTLKALFNLLGRHSFAIYLTHEAFQYLWKRIFPSPWITALMCVLSGIIFGIAADWLFSKITAVFSEKRNGEKRMNPEDNKNSAVISQAIPANFLTQQ